MKRRVRDSLIGGSLTLLVICGMWIAVYVYVSHAGDRARRNWSPPPPKTSKSQPVLDKFRPQSDCIVTNDCASMDKLFEDHLLKQAK